MSRDQLLETLKPFGFTFTMWEHSGDVTIEHPLCEDFWCHLNANDAVPTPLEIMDDFYRSARRDESNDHRCW